MGGASLGWGAGAREGLRWVEAAKYIVGLGKEGPREEGGLLWICRELGGTWDPRPTLFTT